MQIKNLIYFDGFPSKNQKQLISNIVLLKSLFYNLTGLKYTQKHNFIYFNMFKSNNLISE